MNYNIHTDGGSRGNPGPAAIGVVIEECPMPNVKCQILTKFGKVIGVTTNNVAEYTAVIEALKWMIQETGDKGQGTGFSIHFFLDSALVVNQLNGLFKVKDEKMRMLMLTVRQLENQISARVSYTAVPREQNSAADFEVNKALDASVS